MPEMISPNTTATEAAVVGFTDKKLNSAKKLTAINYALYAASIFLFFTAPIAILINYIKEDIVADSWLKSHFRWQRRTFWCCLFWSVFTLAVFPRAVGMMVLSFVVVWFFYRVIRGAFHLYKNKAMYS